MPQAQRKQPMEPQDSTPMKRTHGGANGPSIEESPADVKKRPKKPLGRMDRADLITDVTQKIKEVWEDVQPAISKVI